MFKRKNGAERNGVSFPDAYTQCHDHFHWVGAWTLHAGI